MVAKSIRTIGFLVLTAAVCRLGDALPLATAKFPGKQGNITFTPTNGFGTYVTGTLTNLTCNNPIGNLLPANPFVGNSSVPCYVGMTIHNLANGQRNSGVESLLNLPLVLWKDAINSTLQLANLYNPARILSCAYIQMTQM
ncbi:hypothetical protein TYRP_010777 [Tyrophagus putrescentiae]|nr:hypothetical protein TYRP_010777 [Tyrophagus putrescentiae]